MQKIKSTDYYGIGTDEYSFWKTTNNGETWNKLNYGGGEVATSSGRIIIGSTSDEGLRYTDDEFTTVKPSNITEGNYGNIIITDNFEFAYASNLDDDTVVVSQDMGENWEVIPGAAAGTDYKFINGELYIYGEGAVTKISGAAAEVVAGNSTIIGEEITLESLTGDGNGVKAALLIVLNKLFLPIFCKRLAGMSYKKLRSFVPTITYSNNTYDSLVKNTNNKLDFEYYCNMYPLSYSLSDITGSSAVDPNSIIFYSSINNEIDAEMENNTILKDTLDYIDKYMEARKEAATNKFSEVIEEISADISSLKELTYGDDSQFSNSLNACLLLANSQKGAVVETMKNIVSCFYTLDNTRKFAILKMMIFNAIRDKAGLINAKIFNIKRANDNAIVTESSFNINFDFGKALDEAVDKYIETLFNMVSFDNTEDDNILIITAANSYNDNKKHFLDYIATKLGLIEGLTAGVNEQYSNNVNDFISGINNIYNGQEGYVTKKQYCIQKYKQEGAAAIAEFEGHHYHDVCVKTTPDDPNLDTYYSTLDDGDKAEFRATMNEYFDNYTFTFYNIFAGLINSVYSEVSNKLKEIVDVVKPGTEVEDIKEYIECDTDGLSDEGVTKTLDYYSQILEKFRTRCMELLDFVNNSFFTTIVPEEQIDITDDEDEESAIAAGAAAEEDINKDSICYYWKTVLKEQQQQILKNWINNYDDTSSTIENLNIVNSSVNNRAELIKNIFINNWKKSKEVI